MSHELGRNACISGLEESSFLLPCSQSLPRPQTGPTAEPASRLKFRSANPFLDYHLGAGPADQRFRDFVLVREQAAHVPRAGRVLGRSVETPKGLKRARRSARIGLIHTVYIMRSSGGCWSLQSRAKRHIPES